MTGHHVLFRPCIEAVLHEALAKRRGVRTLVRGIVQQEAGHAQVTTTGPQGLGILRSMSLANGLIDLPEERERVRPGEPVRVMLLR